ncbi:MAG: lysine--tRNA ligase [Candidatus Yanofskybacteria bacterium]|nr:lysine--tRNA ligase [Candidatus Yanofskybacteria bacterium]
MPLEDLKATRREKLEKLKRAGVNPYPAKSWRNHSVQDVLQSFEKYSEDKIRVVLAGRIRAIREHGGVAFLDLDDGTAQMQVLLKKDNLGKADFDLFSETVDIGDIIEVSGPVFVTTKGEQSVEAEKYRLLTKTLLPLPEKWHGLQDVEDRFRKRYLDLIFNPDIRRKFQTRTKIIQGIRDFLNQHEFMEVVTPTLQPLYGGASARPFKTHLHYLDLDLFLRIAPELYLKRLLVGGFNNVFEFTTNFRNEGIDRDHNPEFSAVEFYAAYKDLDWAMDFTEQLFEQVVTNVAGGKKVIFQEQEVDFSRPFTRATFNDLLKKHAGVDYDYADEETLRNKAQELGLKIDKVVSKAGLADEIFKKAIRLQLVQPTFVTEWPADLLPLAKRLENPDYVGAFQFFAGGLEMIKAFSELNDPIDQRARFANQEENRGKGDEEAQRMDEDFIEALEYGMPPAAGWGLGIDRFVMLLTDSHSVRETILFPLMKPKDEERR